MNSRNLGSMALSYNIGEVVDSDEVTEFKTAFSTESKHRNFKLQCKDDVIFVNGVFLSELSEFFDAAFFGSFSEAETKSLSLPEENLPNVLEFLAIIYGKKNVRDRNCALMMHYADLWNVPSLRQKCKEYLSDNDGFLSASVSVADSMKILECALSTDCKDLVENVVCRLAAATSEELEKENLLERIDDRSVIAAIYKSLHLRQNEDSVRHSFSSEYLEIDLQDHNWFLPVHLRRYEVFIRLRPTPKPMVQPNEHKCNFFECKELVIRRCFSCGLGFCDKHTTAVVCPNNRVGQGVNEPVCPEVLPYKMHHVPVDADILFKE